MIDWRGLPRHVTAGLLRAAIRIARDGHTVAFTGQEYMAGPELTIDGHLTVTRHIDRQPGPPGAPGTPGELLAAVVADLIAGAAHIAIVYEQPGLSQDDARRTVTTRQPQLGAGQSGAVDIYGYDWTVHL